MRPSANEAPGAAPSATEPYILRFCARKQGYLQIYKPWVTSLVLIQKKYVLPLTGTVCFQHDITWRIHFGGFRDVLQTRQRNEAGVPGLEHRK